MPYINYSFDYTLVIGQYADPHATQKYLRVNDATVLATGQSIDANAGVPPSVPYGASGVYISLGVAFTNNGTITAAFGGGESDPKFGANGGIGVDVEAAATINNNFRIYGGIGGKGGYVQGGTLVGSPGVGGAGVALDVSGAVFHNYIDGVVYGGHGSYNPGAGGAGGVAASVGAGVTVTNAGLLYGGLGGPGFSKGGAGGAGVDLSNGGTLDNTGRVLGGSGGGESSGAAAGAGGDGVDVAHGALLTNEGTITAGTGGRAGGVSGPQGVGVYLHGGTLDNTGAVSGATADGYAVKFGTQAGNLLILEAKGSFVGNIGGFKAGDTVRITNFSTENAVFDDATDTLTTKDEGTLHFTGDAGYAFSFSAVNADGSVDLTTDAPCYRRGTRILTPRGEVPIESLRIGDAVTTQWGVAKAIRWIGRRAYTGRFASGNADVLPVLIRRDALQSGAPARDLWVSPAHAMLVEGLLVPARALVNGASIIQESAVDEVSYFHLEFESHEIIVAEGALGESYVDDDSRAQFDNAAEYARLYPRARPMAARFCAPRAEEGHGLEAVRARIATHRVPAGVPSHCI